MTNFVAPHSLSRCYDLVVGLESQRGLFSSSSTQVEIYPLNNGYRFEVRRKRRKRLTIHAIGTINYKTDHTTDVEVEVSNNQTQVALLMGTLVMLFLVMVVFEPSMVIILFIAIPAFAWQFIDDENRRQMLLDDIYTCLADHHTQKKYF